MHIVNVMFGKGLGGIEQALVDYCEALKMQGHKVTAIISKKAKIKPALLPLGVNIIEIKTLGSWDFLAKAYIKKVMGQAAPDAVIAHGNRAVSLVSGLSFIVCGKSSDKLPTINDKRPFLLGVTHNYSIKHLIGLDAIIATTEDLKNKVIAAGQPSDKVIKLPNMVRIGKGEGRGAKGEEKKENPSPLSHSHSPLVIGAMGRFVKKKGFDVFIRALAELKAQGLAFEAVIGGGGEEENNLKRLAAELGLVKEGEGRGARGEGIEDSNSKNPYPLSFLGWVENKQKFFEDIDIFVLPSLHEPFGIILLEAVAHGKPVVVTDSEGPSEIASNGMDALIVPKGDSKALADAVNKLASDAQLAHKLGQNAFAKAETYDIKHFARQLSDALNNLLKKQ